MPAQSSDQPEASAWATIRKSRLLVGRGDLLFVPLAAGVATGDLCFEQTREMAMQRGNADDGAIALNSGCSSGAGVERVRERVPQKSALLRIPRVTAQRVEPLENQADSSNLVTADIDRVCHRQHPSAGPGPTERGSELASAWAEVWSGSFAGAPAQLLDLLVPQVVKRLSTCLRVP